MSSDIAVVQTKATVAEAAQIMNSHNISCIVALEENEVQGIITERDMLKRVIAPQKNPAHINVEKVMSSPVTTVSPYCSVFSAYKVMEKMHVRRLVVMENEQLRGIVTQTDILRVTKKRLQENFERDFESLQHSESNIYTVDSDGRITYANPAFMKLFEVSDPAELINQPFLQERFWVNPEERTQYLRQLKKKNVVIKELALKTFKGKKIFITTFSTFTKNIHGCINGFQGILHDITNRKKAEKALWESEEKYRTLYESSRDAIMMLAPSTRRLIAGNQATIELFGVQNEEELKTKCLSDVSPEYQPDGQLSSEKAKDMIEKTMKEGSNFFEWKHMKLDGKEFFSTVLLTRVELKGEELLRATIRDITERKRAEETIKIAYEQLEQSHRELKEMQSQLVQNEKLASIGQLAAGVAHEMNTPVGFVTSQDMFTTYDELIGQIETLRKTELLNKLEGIVQFRDDLQIDFILEDIQGLFDDSREGLNRITEIVQNLRDFSRIDQPGIHDKYNINKGINATLVVAKNEIKYYADVKTDLSEVPPIFCHSGQINQVFLNILVNAAQAIKTQERYGNGTITIRTYATETEVVCEISDDGPGIPPDNLSKILEPFFTTKPVGKGTGLGLSISYDIIVNKHNGGFFVESTVGEGTKFTIKLPISTKENDEQEIMTNGKENCIICG